MKISLVLAVAAVAMSGCMQDAVGSTTGALGTISDCDVSGVGVFVGGEAFAGEASDIAGVETIDWTHDATGVAFLTSSFSAGPFDGIECRANGEIGALFFGTGTATVNGEPGYSYQIDIEDNRPAPTIVCTGGDDDDDDIDEDLDEGIDEDDDGHCDRHRHTRGRGHHSHGRGHGYGHDCDHDDDDDDGDDDDDDDDVTCTSVPAPGDPDEYSITIWDPSGEFYYASNPVPLLVEDGDIAIDLLP